MVVGLLGTGFLHLCFSENEPKKSPIVRYIPIRKERQNVVYNDGVCGRTETQSIRYVNCFLFKIFLFLTLNMCLCILFLPVNHRMILPIR